MQVGLGRPMHGRLWLLHRWLWRPRSRRGSVHGGNDGKHHQQLSREEQVDLGHGEKGSGVSEHSLSPSTPFWINSPAKEQRLQSALVGLIPLCSDDSDEIMKIAADLQLFPHPSRLSRHAG